MHITTSTLMGRVGSCICSVQEEQQIGSAPRLRQARVRNRYFEAFTCLQRVERVSPYLTLLGDLALPIKTCLLSGLIVFGTKSDEHLVAFGGGKYDRAHLQAIDAD